MKGFVFLLVVSCLIFVGRTTSTSHLTVKPGVADSSTPVLFLDEDPVGDILSQIPEKEEEEEEEEEGEDSEIFDLLFSENDLKSTGPAPLDEIGQTIPVPPPVKILPRGLDQTPIQGLSSSETDYSMLPKAALNAITALTLRQKNLQQLQADQQGNPLLNSNDVEDPRTLSSVPLFSRPELNPVPDAEAVPPEEEWTTGIVRDGLLQKELPLPVPLPINAIDRDIQDRVVIADTTSSSSSSPSSPSSSTSSSSTQSDANPSNPSNLIFGSGVGPWGVEAVSNGINMKIARGIVHRNHRMGFIGGNFEQEKTVHGRSEWSYDPTIPNTLVYGADFSDDIDPSDHKGGTERSKKVFEEAKKNLAKGRPFGYSPKDDEDDPEGLF